MEEEDGGNEGEGEDEDNEGVTETAQFRTARNTWTECSHSESW